VPRTLIVTNDFPPLVGGIESFVAVVVELLDHDVLVYTSASPGAARLDRSLDYEVVRGPRVLLPTAATTRAAGQLLATRGATRVLFGAAAPLGLMATALRRAGADRIVALSHGHETWWATLPGSRRALARLADDVDHLSTISDFTASRIAPVLSASARAQMIRLAPPVNPAVFCPSPSSRAARPRVVAVGRLVRQKGHDTLLRAWRLLLDDWPRTAADPELVVLGDGPQRARLERLRDRLRLSGVLLPGAVGRAEVVSQLQQAHVFALPMRTRFAGLNPEGLGLAAIEAAACGLPVVVGRSGGAPETVRDGVTGTVVEPGDVRQLADVLGRLLADPVRARSMGEAGRRYVSATFGIEGARRVLREALDLT
jgi:phosphatidylinositol alpha-1,6-mannosyltransferase